MVGKAATWELHPWLLAALFHCHQLSQSVPSLCPELGAILKLSPLQLYKLPILCLFASLPPRPWHLFEGRTQSWFPGSMAVLSLDFL